MPEPEYPEHEKLAAKERESLLIGEFLEFLGEQGMRLGFYHTHGDACWQAKEVCELNTIFLNEWGKTPEEIIGMFLGIDPKKLREEKEQMEKGVRKGAKGRTKRSA